MCLSGGKVVLNSMNKYKAKEQKKQDLLTKATKKKHRNQILTYLIKNLVSVATWENIRDCNTFMMLVSDQTMEKKKQHKGNSCKNRFCPICSWKKARKDALALSVMMQYLKEEEEKEFVFLTLTAPNVKAAELEDEINHYNHSFQKLMQRKEVKTIVKGYVRKLEITYNEKRDDYHPHFHVLIAVNKSYFTDKNYYINRNRWLVLWQQVTKNNLITQVDVRKVSNSKDDKVFEVAKYSAKDSEYLVNQEVFNTFYKALKGKRILSYSGLFKEAMTKFKAGDLEKYKEQDTTQYVYALLYNWGKKAYIEEERRLLTEEEQKEVNGQLFDELEIEE